MGPHNMGAHIVRDGEYFDQIAFRHGWKGEALWKHPCNRALREEREDPNILSPGDVVNVPLVAPEPLPLRLESANPFAGDFPRVCVRIRLLGSDGKPIAGESFTLEGMETPRGAATTPDGVAEFRPALLTRDVVLVLPKRGERYTVIIGGLDPMDESSGRRQRLANLGYCAHESLGEDTSESEIAVAMQRLLSERGDNATNDAEPDPAKTLTERHAR